MKTKQLVKYGIFLCGMLFLGITPSKTEAKPTQNQIMAIVQIQEQMMINNKLEPYTSGSGLIFDKEGRILTNYHVVENVIKNHLDFIPIVCLTFSVKESPSCYNVVSNVIKYDSAFDVAVLQITKFWDKDQQEFIPLNTFLNKKGISYLPYVNIDRMATDDKIELGDDMEILGYPGVGGPTITYTKGTVSGFETIKTKDGSILPYQIKTDTTINPGNSGGGAFDMNHEYIGIPTAVAGKHGNIGYIISLPIINYVLNGIPDTNANASTCIDLVNGYLGKDGECWCNKNFGWSEKDNRCTPLTPSQAQPDTRDVNLCTNGKLVIDQNACIRLNKYCSSQTPNSFWSSASIKCECERGYTLNESSKKCEQSTNTPIPSTKTVIQPPTQEVPISITETHNNNPSLARAEIIALEKTFSRQSDAKIVAKYNGKILRSIINGKEIYWYINPQNKKRYLIDSPSDLLTLIQGISIFVDSKKITNIKKFPTPFLGKFIVNKDGGESWYVNPSDKKLYRLNQKKEDNVPRYDLGFELLKSLSIKADTTEIRKISVN